MSQAALATRSESRFFLVMAIVASAIVFIGFAPSFYLKGLIQAPVPQLSLLTTVHGIVFTLWMVLFITQAFLIHNARPEVHRQLGMLGVLLFGIMVTLGFWTAISAGRLGHAPPGAPEPLAFMALPLFGITGSLVLVALALWNRRYSDWHKRLMLSAMFSLTGPGTGRILIAAGIGAQPHISLLVSDILILIAMGFDYLTARRIHMAYLYALAVMIVVQVFVAWGFASPTWHAVAQTLTQE
jgi:hypothetical protein